MLHYALDTDRYVNSGATDHITSELDKLTVRDKYNGTEKVHTTSGVGMEISSIGKSFIHTPHRRLDLLNVLHVPKATKKILCPSIVFSWIRMFSLKFTLDFS
jgi:hypothetical protein